MAYDSEQYWDAKARASAHDARGAVCVGDAARDLCIDRVQRRLMRLALAHIESRHGAVQGRALDIGCGTGRWARDLAAIGLAYHGIDISAAMIEFARREHPAASFAKFDGQAIPFADGNITMALSLAVIHHNTFPRQERLLDELVRVLAPGGRLILFEGIGPRASGGDGVFFYRPAADWRAALAGRGLALKWQRGARYFALEHLGRGVASRLGIGGAERWSPALLKLGARVDPYLISSSPNRLHDRWFAIWRKPALVTKPE